MKKITLLVFVLLISVKLLSCGGIEGGELNQYSLSGNTDQHSTPNHVDYDALTEKEMRSLAIADDLILEDGDEVISVISLLENNDLNIRQVSKNTGVQAEERLSFDDLDFYHYSPEQVRQDFHNRFGVNPDGISVNHETRFNAVDPAITAQYGHWCYNKIHYPNVYNKRINTNSMVIFETYAENYGNSPIVITKLVEKEFTEETNWNITTGASISLEAKLGFSIPFVVNGETKITVTGTIEGSEGGKKIEKTKISESASVTVPERSKKKIKLVMVEASGTADLFYPIKLDGWFGANFPKRVEGHYFWFMHYTGSSTMVVRVNDTRSLRAYITVGMEEPI